MDKINWKEKLGWSDEQLEELRFAGYSYIKQGKYDIALSFFEALVLLAPDSLYDFQTLGALYLQLNHPAKSLSCFEHILKIDKNHGPTLLNLAKALLMLGKKNEALKLIHRLTEDKDTSIASVAKALVLAYS